MQWRELHCFRINFPTKCIYLVWSIILNHKCILVIVPEEMNNAEVYSTLIMFRKTLELGVNK